MRLTHVHPTTDKLHVDLLPVLFALIGAVIFSFFIGLTSKPVADFLYYNVLRLDNPALNALEFAVYPLVIAFGVMLWRPAYYGLHLGSTVTHWRLVFASLLGVAVVVGAYVLMGNRTPWDSKGLVNFTVVPLYEELLFRGVLFTLILSYARRHYAEKQSLWVAILVSTLGFGLGHASNGFYVGWSFALFQVAYASLFGLLAGYVRARTDSVIGPILLHGLMNALPIIL